MVWSRTIGQRTGEKSESMARGCLKEKFLFEEMKTHFAGG